MQDSNALRATLHQLEAQAETAGAALIAAETHHRAQLRRSVEAHDFTLSVVSEAALADARREYDRSKVSAEVARDLLREQVQRERKEAQAQARHEISAELTEMRGIAHQLDTQFAALVGAIVALQAREAELHQKARAFFRTPHAAPRSLSAARPLATVLSTLANGGQPDMRPVIEETLAAAARNIEATFDAA